MTIQEHLDFVSKILIVALLVPATDARCVQTTSSAGAIGDTVHFYICETPYLGFKKAPRELTVTSEDLDYDPYIDGLRIVNGTAQAGWFWQIVTSDSRTYVNISFMIESRFAFVTYKVSFGNSPQAGDISHLHDGKSAVKNTHLTVNHAGPPQPCLEEYRAARPIVVELSTNISSSGSYPICFVSQSGSQLTSTKDVSTSCNMSPKATSTFKVEVFPYRRQSVVHELMVEVASLSYADLGTWMVNVTNGNGTLEVHVTVKAKDFTCPEETQEESDGDGEGDGITFIIVGVCLGLLLVAGIVALILYRRKARRSTPPDVLTGTAEQNQKLNESLGGTKPDHKASNRKSNRRKDHKRNGSWDGEHGNDNGDEDEEKVIANPVYEPSSSALVPKQSQDQQGQPRLQEDEIVIANPVYEASTLSDDVRRCV